MHGAIQSLYDGCLLSVSTSGTSDEGWTPAMGLWQGCCLRCHPVWPLHLMGCMATWRPMLQVQACRSSSCLCELVYANDICLMASSTEHLQALLNALASCRALRHMEISVPKTKVMVASSVVQTPHSFTCNGRDIQQVGVLRYLELQMHPLAMLLIPLHVPRLPALEGGGAAKACRAAVR